MIDQLRAVSDDWLKEKAAAEKGFSLGFFDADYLSRFPVAVVERGGAIEASPTSGPDRAGPSSRSISCAIATTRPGTPWRRSSST